MLLATQYDVGLDPIQQGEVGFKQCASLDGGKGQGLLSVYGIFFTPRSPSRKKKKKETNLSLSPTLYQVVDHMLFASYNSYMHLN